MAELDMIKVFGEIMEGVHETLLRSATPDKDVMTFFECLHDEGISYEKINRALWKVTEKKQKEKGDKE